jgi:hypothetical protein
MDDKTFETEMDDAEEYRQSVEKMWVRIYEMANVPATGPGNREERRRVEKVLRRIEKRGLTIGR